MRLVYSKVHPDLFHNYIDAKITNENSLKSLKTLIDNSKELNTSYQQQHHSSKVYENLVFYVKQTTQVKIKNHDLKRVEINSKDKNVEYLLNELIDQLELKVDKLHSTIKKNNVATTHYASYDSDDDDSYDFEESFEDRAYSRPVIIKLNSWLENVNKSEMETRIARYTKLNSQIEANRIELTDKLKFKNIYWQSNWSLNNFNSYLLALKTLKVNHTFDFIDLNIILTDNNFSGLQKDGFICLNCHQVIQQWLEVLNECKKYEFVIKEIKVMEQHLQSSLFNIKLNDSLFNKTKFQIKSAFNHYATLNYILNKFVKHEQTHRQHDFFNLQLVIDDFNSIDLNEAGQFLIGSNIRDYAQVVDYIQMHQQNAIELHTAYLKSKLSIDEMKMKLMRSNRLKSITFDSSLMDRNIISCLGRLLNTSNFPGHFKNLEIVIGTNYQLNENGSITIPWNWID